MNDQQREIKIIEAMEKKLALEKTILTLIQEFESTVGLHVTDIELEDFVTRNIDTGGIMRTKNALVKLKVEL